MYVSNTEEKGRLCANTHSSLIKIREVDGRVLDRTA